MSSEIISFAFVVLFHPLVKYFHKKKHVFARPIQAEIGLLISVSNEKIKLLGTSRNLHALVG